MPRSVIVVTGTERRYLLVNDDTYQRRVMFEEVNPNMPGQQFFQTIFFFSTNVMYLVTLSNAGQPAACTKNTIPFPYRPVRAMFTLGFLRVLLTSGRLGEVPNPHQRGVLGLRGPGLARHR